MKIKKMLSQSRRDFTAIMKCENCEHEEKNDSGYDDSFYHQNVIPNMECKSCGMSSKSMGNKIEDTITKYPEGFQI